MKSIFQLVFFSCLSHNISFELLLCLIDFSVSLFLSIWIWKWPMHRRQIQWISLENLKIGDCFYFPSLSRHRMRIYERNANAYHSHSIFTTNFSSSFGAICQFLESKQRKQFSICKEIFFFLFNFPSFFLSFFSIFHAEFFFLLFLSV